MSGPIINKIRVKELKFQFLKGVESRVNVTKTEYEERTIGVSYCSYCNTGFHHRVEH